MKKNRDIIDELFPDAIGINCHNPDCANKLHYYIDENDDMVFYECPVCKWKIAINKMYFDDFFKTE